MKGVVFNYSTLLVDNRDPGLVAALRVLLENLRGAGQKLVVLSTNPRDINAALKDLGLPSVDFVITKDDVGVNKGSPAWIRAAADKIGARPHELLYVGSDVLDWRTAINAATFYQHAGWVSPRAPAGTTTFVASRPETIWLFATHFLMQPPRWSYTLDVQGQGLHLRSLLGAGVSLPSTEPASSFTLQDVFTYENQVKVGEASARNLLMIHAISSLYLEGLIAPNTPFAVYPSSKPGKISRVLQDFIKPASSLFHGYFREVLLVRAAEAPDTSIERAKARKEGRAANVGFSNQTDTVHVNPKYKRLVRGRTVVVFDDFTTTGMSLEWARNLLLAAGAARVIMITIGKYSSVHNVYVPVKSGLVTPFALRQYKLDAFKRTQTDMKVNANAPGQIQQSLALWIQRKPYTPPRAA